MANRHNAIKKIAKDARRTARNRMVTSEIRTIARSFREACDSKDTEKAGSISRQLFSQLDQGVKRGVLKENTANRKKSRFAKKLAQI